MKFSPHNAVAQGTTVIFKLPTDRRYWKLLFRYTRGGSAATQANFETDFTEIRTYINDKLVRRGSARQYIDMYTYYGRPHVDGMFQLFLGEPWRRNAANEELLAWSMGGVKSFRIEIDMGASITTPVFAACLAEWDQPVTAEGKLPRLGLINQHLPRNIGVTSTGDKEIIDLPTDDGVYSAIHCQEGSAADINSVKVELGQRVIIDTANDEDLNQFGEMENPAGYAPVADNTHIKFDRSGMFSDTLDPKNKLFKVTANMANATDFVLFNEIIGQVI